MPEDKKTVIADTIVTDEIIVENKGAKPAANQSGSLDVKDGVVNTRWRYDGTITLGHLLIMFGIITSGIGLYTTTVVKLSRHDDKITTLERLSEAQGQYNKAALEILNELKQFAAVTDALAKDRLTRPVLPTPDEFKQKDRR